MKNLMVATLTALVMIAPALAWTNIRAVYDASGKTEINELSTIAGYDYSEDSMQVTGYIHEGVKNEGTLFFNKEITTPGAWEMTEAKEMWGTGETKFKKEVVWWTEDPTEDCCTGLLKWPTVAHIFTGFYTMNEEFTDEEEIDNIANLPVEDPQNPGEYSANYFLKVWDTDDDFYFKEGVGINMEENCEPHIPHSWRMPRCSEFCPQCC